MKRMKKKVVAMVTLAMFVLSMVPMAAFAANPKYNLNNSSVELALENPTVEVGSTAAVTIDAKDVTGATIEGKTDNDLYVWFEKEGAVVYDSVSFASGDAAYIDNNTAVKFNGKKTAVTVTFKEAGTYTLHAGVSASTAEVTSSDNLVGEIKVPETKNTVTVTAKDFPVKSVEGVAPVSVPVDQQNDIQTVPGSIKVTANDENVVPARTPIKFVNSYEKEGLTILNANGEKTNTLYTAAEIAIKGDATVAFKVKVAPNTIPGLYTYNLECNGAKGTVVVEVLSNKDNKKAATIKAVPVETVIDSQSKDAAKAIAFEVRNVDGQLIDIANAGEPMVADKAPFNKADYVTITGPNGVKVAVTNVTFVQDSETKNTVMSFVTGDFDDVFSKAGEYTVKVTLKNGQSATSTFTVDKFAGAEEIVIEPAKETGSNVVLNGVAGSEFDVYAVDKNGVKSKLDSDKYTLAYSPVAKDVTVALVETTGNPSVIKASIDNTVDKNDVLGTKIAVTAMYKDGANNTLFATHDFTIVDKTMLTEYELAFDKTEGKALEITEVTPSIVKKSDKDAKLDVKEVYAKVLSSTNKDAIVNVKVDKNNKINIYSDKDTSLEVQVIVTSEQNKTDVVYSGTLTFNVGKTAEEQAEKKLVAVTVGSSDYIVNNKVVKGDAAPYIKDNRTFVPVRAVTEALGADVVYNEADNTVTVELDGTTVVMTIGSKDYTVDGEKKTMDVAPEAKAGRTYLPGRFLGEAFGFSVNPLTSTTGDVTVVFTK